MRSDSRSWQDEIRSGSPTQNVGAALVSAIETFLANDAFLLESDANEKSITHRLALYLEKHFHEVGLQYWNIDCEYNRNVYESSESRLHDPKRLGRQPGRRVFPDIVVHRRGERKNLLAIEVKKAASHQDRRADLAKLRGFREELGYQSALFLQFTVEPFPPVVSIQWVNASDFSQESS